MNLISLTALVTLSFALLRLAHTWNRARARRKLMPPGPPGLPFVGNIFQLPKLQWLKFAEWKEQYGAMYSLNMAGQPVVVLNSLKVTADLIERRSNIYSDRPKYIVAGDYLTGGISIAFAPHGDFWRRLRRTAHEGLNVRAAQAYRPMQEREAARLVMHMIRDPLGWDASIKRTSASTILGALYGWTGIGPENDELVKEVNEHVHRLDRACMPGANIVEILPFLDFLPAWMAKWKREAIKWHDRDSMLFMNFMRTAREKTAAGKLDTCFVAQMEEQQKRLGITEKEAAWLAGIMFGAGADTTGGTLVAFVLAMVLYPDVMRKAQAEIDEVIGRDRLPTFGDLEHLPYLRAVVKETLRWRPVGPIGMPRYTYQDDWYEGYLIPKGTLVIANTWAMNRDPAYFPDFEEFRPERFMTSDDQDKDAMPDDELGELGYRQGHTTFGFGRRVCIGMNLANQSLFIGMAMMLWGLEFGKAKDSQTGEEITPDRMVFADDGLSVRPAPFACSIRPRAVDVLSVLERQFGKVGK